MCVCVCARVRAHARARTRACALTPVFMTGSRLFKRQLYVIDETDNELASE